MKYNDRFIVVIVPFPVKVNDGTNNIEALGNDLEINGDLHMNLIITHSPFQIF